MLKIKVILRNIAINASILGLGLSFIEIILSKYFSYSPAYDVPEAQVDVKKIYDTSKLEFPRDFKRSTYIRDKSGYRPYDKSLEDNGIILTIGGSTTDQRFVDDQRTWQSKLEKELKQSVINGGVDGQSTFGHIVSIEKWHSKSLESKDVNAIIFYVGTNDIRYAKGLESLKGNIYDSPTKLRRLRSYLAHRSFFYSKAREVKTKLDYILGKELEIPDGTYKIGHNLQNPNFISIPQKSMILMSKDNEIYPYEVLFKKLLLTTKNKFSNAAINIVQQQDPRCLIKELKNGEIYFRVSKKEIKYIDKYCVELASIYMGQEKVIREFDNLEINLIKMFQDNPIPDNGFYDGIHTNTLGANYIANYLKERLKMQKLSF